MKRAVIVLLVFACSCCCLGTMAQADPPRVGLIQLDGIVHPITADYIVDALHECSARGYAAAVIQLNTPGGLDDAMRTMIQAILASPVPVIVWVGPSGSRAASAGFLILLSADVAAMALGTNTGAAHPVFMSGKEMDPVMKQKVENDAAAYLRSFAATRGRNPEVAVTGVIESKSFSETEALNDHMIDVIANSPEELLKKLDGRTIRRFQGQTVTLHLAGAEIVPIEPTSRQAFLSRVIEPNIALVLAAIGVLGLFVEFNHPGMILPGVVGAICLILGLFAFTLLPINLTGALLILLGLSLFVIEAKVGSHGILAVGGIVSLVMGAVILVKPPITGPELGVRLSTALALAIPLGAITVFLLRLALQARRAKVLTGAAGLLDEVGVVQGDFAAEPDGSVYRGQVFVQGEIWQAAATAPLTRGSRVRVRAVEGLHLRVEPVSAVPA